MMKKRIISSLEPSSSSSSTSLSLSLINLMRKTTTILILLVSLILLESSVSILLEAEEEVKFDFLDSMDSLQAQQQQILIGDQQQRNNNEENHLLLDDEEFPYDYVYQKEITKAGRDQQHWKKNKERRRLDYNLLVDPKSVQFKKIVEQNNNNNNALVAATQSLKVLALGGSVTWGAGLADRFQSAYPYLLSVNPRDTVDNLAIRATGATYPSLCIQSMIAKENGGSRSGSSMSSSSSSYDVIILDFVLNGTQGFALLIERLRKRYPNAILIYVKLWSFKHNIECSNGLVPMDANNDLKCDWVWRPGSKEYLIQFAASAYNNGGRSRSRRRMDILNGRIQNLSDAEDIVLNAGGYIYALPFPEDMFDTPQGIIDSGWFCTDFHHLSEVGHAVLANGLLDLLSSVDVDRRGQQGLLRGTTTTNFDSPSHGGANHLDNSRLVLEEGSWGQGDQCYNWFASGDSTGIHYSGATMETLPVADQSKHVLAVTGTGTSITGSSTVASLQFHSYYDHKVPIYIAYLGSMKRVSVILDDGTNLDKFPIVKISVNDNSHYTHIVDPNGSNDSPFYATISMFQLLGWAIPGDNTITVQADTLSHEPFQILGVMLCGYCAGFESEKLLLK